MNRFIPSIEDYDMKENYELDFEIINFAEKMYFYYKLTPYLKLNKILGFYSIVINCMKCKGFSQHLFRFFETHGKLSMFQPLVPCHFVSGTDIFIIIFRDNFKTYDINGIETKINNTKK